VLTSRAWERQARLAFASYRPEDAYISEFTVSVDADGLTATAPVITTPEGYGLAASCRSWPMTFEAGTALARGAA
jgi:hypothetical protein